MTGGVQRLLCFHDFSEECDDELAFLAASRVAGLRVDVVVVDSASRVGWLQHVVRGPEARGWALEGSEIVTGARARLRFFVAEATAQTASVEAAIRARMGAASARDGAWPVAPLRELPAQAYDSILVAAPLRGVSPALFGRVRAGRAVVVGDRGGINCSGYDWAGCEAALRTYCVSVAYLPPELSRRVCLPTGALGKLPDGAQRLAWGVVLRFLGQRPEGPLAPALCLRFNAANARMCERWVAEARGGGQQPAAADAEAERALGAAVDAYVARHCAGVRADDLALLAELRAAGEGTEPGPAAASQEAVAAAYARALRRSVRACVRAFAQLSGGGEPYARPLSSLSELAEPAEASISRLQRAGLRSGTPCYDLLGLMLALARPAERRPAGGQRGAREDDAAAAPFCDESVGAREPGRCYPLLEQQAAALLEGGQVPDDTELRRVISP